VLTGDHRGASAIANALLDEEETLVEIEQHVIQPSLYGIGQKWESGVVSVTQEHRATAIALAVMAEARTRLPRPSANGGRALLACVAGNEHAVGLGMVRDAFHLAGWAVETLGANAATAIILTSAAALRPDIVGLSVSRADQLPTLRDVITRMREYLPGRMPRIIIGGQGLNQFEHPARVVGADGYAENAQGAVAWAKSLVHAKRSFESPQKSRTTAEPQPPRIGARGGR
jgi:MerR family transcriptional regulator, light-induced transcriptional regulator